MQQAAIQLVNFCSYPTLSTGLAGLETLHFPTAVKKLHLLWNYKITTLSLCCGSLLDPA